MGAVRADEVVAVLVCVFHGANGAGWGGGHVLAFCFVEAINLKGPRLRDGRSQGNYYHIAMIFGAVMVSPIGVGCVGVLCVLTN